MTHMFDSGSSAAAAMSAANKVLSMLFSLSLISIRAALQNQLTSVPVARACRPISKSSKALDLTAFSHDCFCLHLLPSSFRCPVLLDYVEKLVWLCKPTYVCVRVYLCVYYLVYVYI